MKPHAGRDCAARPLHYAADQPVPTLQLIKLAVVKTLLEKQKQRVQTKQIHKASLSQAVRHWTKNELQGTFGAFRRLLAASPTANTLSLAGASPAHSVRVNEDDTEEGSWEMLDIWDDRPVVAHLASLCFVHLCVLPRDLLCRGAQDMMEAIDAYYAKRLITARFEDWKKRRMCVAQDP